MKNKNTFHPSAASDSYEAIRETPVVRYVGKGRHPKHGNEQFAPVTEYDSIASVETKLINNTDRLIAALDGSVQFGEVFLDGERRFESPVDGAIYLDKSARPVRALVHNLWNDMSESPEPVASFLNIDKENWIYAMGFTPSEFRNSHLPTHSIDIDKIDPDYLLMQTARIRSLYLQDIDMEGAETLLDAVTNGNQPTEALSSLWDFPTKVDGKHIAIVDEVKSSGATLKIADQLLQRALPEAKLEPLYFQTTPVLKYDFYDESRDEMVSKIADAEKPLWYMEGRAEGRGGIYDPLPEYSQNSHNRQQRIGKFVLSTPYRLAYNDPDSLGRAFRNDFKKLAQRFREGKVVDYLPATDDTDAYKTKIERYYGLSFKNWLQKRRRGDSMTGAER
jgi:hypothetical protein